jgi:oligoribonuclease NrnB/cAMP/cGMP phosphodiesterase (DHH superfamily)
LLKCFYHDDLDGRAAAFCVHAWVGIKKFPADFIPMDYSKPFPFDTIVPGEQIWIVDYSIKPEEMDRLLAITEDVTWIDHHKTAIERYADYPRHIKGIRQDGEAGCVLAWKYIHWWSGRGSFEDFNPPADRHLAPVPLAIELVGDRDIWAWRHGETTRKFYAASQAHDTKPDSEFWWKCLDRELDPKATEGNAKAKERGENWWTLLLISGQSIEDYRKRFYADYREALAFPVTFEGHKALAMNVARVGSEAFGDDEVFQKYEILMPFCYDGRQFTVSLYSKAVDVSELAKARGGGGHKGAAGFQCAELPFAL